MGVDPRSRMRRQQERQALARRAEQMVAHHLQACGYQILGRNLRFGQDELDLVAQRGELIIICEVRSRSSSTWVSPAHTITPAKQRSLRRGAGRLIRAWHLEPCEVRLDLAAVSLDRPSNPLVYLEGAL